MNNHDDEVEIDVLRLLRALWKKAWAIALAAAICGASMLAYTVFFVKPLYKAEALMYVNSSDISVGGTKVSISQGELSAAKSLVNTYSVILNTRSTLNEVIEAAGVNYTYMELQNMISAQSVNSTEIFSVEVTSTSPQEAELLANTIADILPVRIASIVEGTSARIVDYAVAPAEKASPSLVKNTAIGVIVGFLLASGVVIVCELMDDKIHDADYLLQTYNIPVLAVIPDLMSTKSDNAYYQKPTRHER